MKKGYVILSLILFLLCTGVAGNRHVFVTTYEIKSDHLPDAFQGFKIVQISDTHIKEVGSFESQIITHLKTIQPDMILLTGDLVDDATFNHTDVLAFLKRLQSLAPTFYSYGNHEWHLSASFEEQIIQTGVTLLKNESIRFAKGEDNIEVIGIDDPFLSPQTSSLTAMNENLVTSLDNQDSYTLLLSHRPEYFDLYVDYGIDLVFSGHAHGGQFRIPFVGGLIAPNQGLFPKYTSGVHQQDNTTLIISRGVGNSVIPIRFYNAPEIILTILSS